MAEPVPLPTAAPGEAFLSDTPVLRSHAGTQPDLFLRWNAIPPGAERVDLVVHLHGFSQLGAEMLLAEKVPRSGLDFSARARPTLALIPRGNWVRHSAYDFPALSNGGFDRLVDHALGWAGLALDRLILTGHSGGVMPALDVIAGSRRQPDEMHLYDGLYGRDPALGDPLRDLATIDRWLGERFAAESERAGALRVAYIDRQTGPMSRAVAALVERHLASADPALGALLSRRYRVERSHVPHSHVAWCCGPDLMADPGSDIDWTRAA
ncbi:MAG TPA: hypothetical protein VHW66_16230 [Stellaceae bacterium]|jgi:hypothetical protein|nr:hypothetical protein [Stellaceae bacterium]